MQTVDHPNIVKYYETYDDLKYLYLVMELCPGGELIDKVGSKENPMSEKELSKVMRDCFQALQHCHSQNIIHRDIKPENIVFDKLGQVKFIDFGFAIIQDKKKSQMEVLGTPYYIAPEVLSRNYGKECDIWSLGVCIFQMLTGEMPFDGSSRKEVFNKICRGEFDAPDHLSDEVVDLLVKMIKVDPTKRITAFDCLDHKWIKMHQDED